MPDVSLVSSDGQLFVVDISIAKHSLTLNRLLEVLASEEGEEPYDSTPIPLPNISSRALEHVIDWCTDQHNGNGKFEIGNEDLAEVIVAANYLDIASLLARCCKAVAAMFKGKSPEDIRKTFGIVNDLFPEEERQIVKETAYFSFADSTIKREECKENGTLFDLLDLPNEILVIIFEQLHIVDRLRARVCRRLFLIYVQSLRYFATKIFFLIGKNMVITTYGRIVFGDGHSRGGNWDDVGIARHNDDGSKPDLECFKKDDSISYILHNCMLISS